MPKVGTYTYPNITIDEALSYVRAFIKKHPRGEMSKETFAKEILGRSPTSSAVPTLIASIGYYGLIKHEKGKIFITDLGKRAVAGVTEEDKLNAIKEALENVNLIKDYWEEHDGVVDDKIVAIFLKEVCGADEIEVSRCLPEVIKILRASIKWLEKVSPEKKVTLPARIPLQPVVPSATPVSSKILGPTLTYEGDYVVFRIPRKHINKFFSRMFEEFTEGLKKFMLEQEVETEIEEG